jgi:hypothetical protein
LRTSYAVDFRPVAGYHAGMPTSDHIFAVHDTRGFVHNGRIVYALQYDLETPPPSSRCLILWLTPDGDCQNPRIQSAYTGKRLATTKPGEHIKVGGKLEKVVSVNVYRASRLLGTP